MYPFAVSALVFLALVIAAIGALLVSEHLPARYTDDATHNVVRHAANVFVVATSLVLGLLLNSARTTYESVDRNVQALATQIVLLDRTLRHYGPDADAARQHLGGYLRQAIAGTWGTRGEHRLDDPVAEARLDEVRTALIGIRPADAMQADLLRGARANFDNVVQQRWALIDESDGSIPSPMVAIVTAWLVLIFASFGYRAPANAVVVATLVVAAFLFATSIYLLLDMDSPFSGTIQVRPKPLQQAIEQISR